MNIADLNTFIKTDFSSMILHPFLIRISAEKVFSEECQHFTQKIHCFLYIQKYALGFSSTLFF